MPAPANQAAAPVLATDVGRLPDRSLSDALQRVPGVKIESRYAYIPSVQMPSDPGNERYAGNDVSPVHLAAAEPVSTFSVDVDTGAYANVRRFLTLGQRPPKDAVRTEELINYFRYDYPAPADRSAPFSVTTDVAQTPWNPNTRLLRIGLRGYDLPRAARPPANLVFLIDVSGSMDEPDKLPLVKAALGKLADRIQPRDRVSIVVYAGAAGTVLPATNDKEEIRAALDRLSAGGSTAGGAGLKLAYNVARAAFIEGGVNRVILATDGDFNVGVSDTRALIEMIEHERDSGITLTTLGFGTGNYNEAMMEQVADHGNGNYAYIDSALEADKVLNDEMASTLFTIAKDVKIQIEFNPAQVSQYRLIGYENRALREEDFDNDKVDAGDIGAGHEVTALYEIVPAGSPGWIAARRYEAKYDKGDSRSDELAYIKLRYKLPDGQTSRLIERTVPAGLLREAAPPRGDMAFAVAVAAYGQKLRGDTLLADYSYPQIASLAGNQGNFWRQEFVRLASLAEGLDGR
jgi:Ca-activated chloride channel family protein